MTPARIGLVLGAGGATGHAFHAGVLWAIADATGWDPRRAEIVVGTSAGSIVASMLRAGFPARDIAARQLGEALSPEGAALARRAGVPVRDARGQSRRRMFTGIASPEYFFRSWFAPWRLRPGMMTAAALPAGRIPSEPLAAPFRPLFGDAWPADPLWICAVALDRGTRVFFGRDGAPKTTVADAVRASCAIPAFYEPAVIDGRRYVDGGVHSPTNADVLAGASLDLVVVSSPMSTTLGASSIDAGSRLYFRWRLAAEALRLRRRGTEVVAFQPTPDIRAAMGLNALDERKRHAIVRRTHDAVLARLEKEDFRDRVAALPS